MNIKFNVTHIESGNVYGPYNGPYDGKNFNDKDVVLKPNTDYSIKISYPLSSSAFFQIKSGTKGTSRGKLVSLIRKYYKTVYEIDKKSKNSKYGIWGHCIGDLVLVDCDISKNNIISLGVDS